MSFASPAGFGSAVACSMDGGSNRDGLVACAADSAPRLNGPRHRSLDREYAKGPGLTSAPACYHRRRLSMEVDVLVVGAGAAGLMCAAEAGRRGRRVVLVDHWNRIGERIRVCGGG